MTRMTPERLEQLAGFMRTSFWDMGDEMVAEIRAAWAERDEIRNAAQLIAEQDTDSIKVLISDRNTLSQDDKRSEK